MALPTFDLTLSLRAELGRLGIVVGDACTVGVAKMLINNGQGPFRDYTALLAEFPDLVTALVIPMRSLPAAAGCPTQPHIRPLASSVVVALFGSVFMRFRAERDTYGPAMYSYKPAALFSSL